MGNHADTNFAVQFNFLLDDYGDYRNRRGRLIAQPDAGGGQSGADQRSCADFAAN